MKFKRVWRLIFTEFNSYFSNTIDEKMYKVIPNCMIYLPSICSIRSEQLRIVFFTLFIYNALIFNVFALRETSDTISSDGPDTTKISAYTQRLQKVGSDGFKQSLGEFEATKTQRTQRIVLIQIKEAVQEAKVFLGAGVDSISIDSELDKIEGQRLVVEKGVFENEGKIKADRNLAVSGAILRELMERTLALRINLRSRSDELFRSSYLIDSLSSIEEIYKFPDDSLETASYARKFVLVAKEIEPTFTELHLTIDVLEKLESKADEVYVQLQSTIMVIENERKELNRNFFSKEVAGFSSTSFSQKSFFDIFKISHEKELLALGLYIKLYSGKIILMFVFIMSLSFFISNLKKRTLQELEEDDPSIQYLVLRYPILSSLIIIIGLFQFLYPSPPYVFYFLLWMISGISLAILFHKFLTPFWMVFWIVSLIIFFVSSSLNMILIFSATERYAIMMLSFIGLVYSAFLLFNNRINQLKEKRIIYFVGFLGVTQTLSLLINLYGGLNLSKALLVSGYLGVVLGISMLWNVRLMNQMLALASTIFNKPDKKLFFINFDKVGEKVPKFFYFLLVIGWVLLVGRNFYGFSKLAGYYRDFLNAPRVLGSYSFTINSIVIFLLILMVSFLLSRIVSFFSSEPDVNPNYIAKRKEISLGSWLLLVQIFIISLGLFLAIAASGVPLDKITIVLGALGVGIGLGLQGLFNNLVSGVIIAFENPVKVGDLIEIDGKPGVMKSIGFRSSVVNMFEGASIIIPNGDLLSNQLVNWTMGKGKKVTIMVGVAYGTDLARTVSLVKEILANEKRILTYPVSRVLPREFADSRIDIEVTFWVHNFLELPFVKGDIISQIDVLFKREGIVIAFPQRDLHFKSGMDITMHDGENTK